MLGQEAMAAGRPTLVSIDELEPDAWVATAAAIGAPAGTTLWEMQGRDYVRAVALLQDALGEPLAGLIIGQNGMSSTLNGWLPGVILGLAVVDAVGDIRAHPTGDMGSLGLAASVSPMIQTAAGGYRASGAYIEVVARGATARISPILRAASDQSGGFIASARNPVRASYVEQHAALGGISIALGLGEAILDAEGKGGAAVIDAICKATGATIIGEGQVTAKRVRYTSEAFDVGTIGVGDLTLHVMNEYMAVDGPDGARLATYPDVITTVTRNGVPVSVGHIEERAELLVLHIDKTLIPLSSSVKDASVYPVAEQALGIPLAAYALA